MGNERQLETGWFKKNIFLPKHVTVTIILKMEKVAAL